jgi:hypothetical protein
MCARTSNCMLVPCQGLLSFLAVNCQFMSLGVTFCALRLTQVHITKIYEIGTIDRYIENIKCLFTLFPSSEIFGVICFCVVC